MQNTPLRLCFTADSVSLSRVSRADDILLHHKDAVAQNTPFRRDAGSSGCCQLTFNSLESLVEGPEPADVGARSEHEKPDDSHSEVGHASPAKHPGKAANEIHSQSSAIH